jgi:hypothetical protein
MDKRIGSHFKSERLLSDGNLTHNPEDMPWNLSPHGFGIWSNSFGNDIVFFGVFWPKNYEILFIINNGDIENSAIVYNCIEEEK